MPPIPESPVSGRTFASSHFKAAYTEAEAPEGPMDLGAELNKLIEAYCEQEGIDWKAEGRPFLQQLQREALRNMDDPIAEMIQRMWTSALRLRGHEFCFLLNRAVRGDDSLADPTAALSRGINKLCVSRAARPPFPPSNVCAAAVSTTATATSSRRAASSASPRTLPLRSEDVARNFIEMRGGSNCAVACAHRSGAQVCTSTREEDKCPEEEEYPCSILGLRCWASLECGYGRGAARSSCWRRWTTRKSRSPCRSRRSPERSFVLAVENDTLMHSQEPQDEANCVCSNSSSESLPRANRPNNRSSRPRTCTAP